MKLGLFKRFKRLFFIVIVMPLSVFLFGIYFYHPSNMTPLQFARLSVSPGMFSYMKALKARQSKNYDEAVELLKRAEQIDPWLSKYTRDHYIGIGSEYFFSGKTKEAISLYHSVLQQDPSNAHARFNLAFSYYKSGQQRDALKEAKKCLELSPNSEWALKAKKIISKIKIKIRVRS